MGQFHSDSIQCSSASKTSNTSSKSNKSLTMLREAAIAALGLASASAFKIAEDVLLKRDGAHAHEHADSGYGAPPATYGEPAPSYGYEEEPLPDLTPIIVGILVLTGLSLL